MESVEEFFVACLLLLYAIAWKYVPVSQVKTSRVESTHVQEVGFGSRFLKNNSLKPSETRFFAVQFVFTTVVILHDCSLGRCFGPVESHVFRATPAPWCI